MRTSADLLVGRPHVHIIQRRKGLPHHAVLTRCTTGWLPFRQKHTMMGAGSETRQVLSVEGGPRVATQPPPQTYRRQVTTETVSAHHDARYGGVPYYDTLREGDEGVTELVKQPNAQRSPHGSNLVDSGES